MSVCKDRGDRRGCGATIVWAKSINGFGIPLDPVPVPGGNLELVGDTAHYVTAEIGVVRYVTHFVTCPFAEENRRG